MFYGNYKLKSSSFKKLLMRITFRFILLIIGFTLINTNINAQQTIIKNYSIAFKKIDSLANQAQPKAALALINNINAQARLQNNTAVLVKSVIYRMLFQSYLEEDAFSKILTDLKQDINLAKQPEKSILQSLLAEMYWKYYEQNLYKISQRTQVLANIGDDIKTWSVKKITDEITKTYILSLKEITLLQNTKVDILDDILTGDKYYRNFRPTLYDLLAHRAIAVFTNTQINLAQNNDDSIDFNNPIWFAAQSNFINNKLPKSDSTSFYLETIQIFKNLLQFHSQQNNNTALADADLKRLKFIYQQRLGNDKFEPYFNALTALANSYKTTEIYADVLYEQALLYQNNQIKPDTNKLYLVKAVELCNTAIKAYPKSIGANNAQVLLQQIKTKTFSLNLKKFNLPNQPLQVLFTYKNVDSVYLKLYKISVYTQELSNLYQKKEYNNFLKKHKTFKEFAFSLPTATDYQTHNFASIIDGLPLGNYALITNNTKDTTSTYEIGNYTTFAVTGMAATYRNLNYKQEYFVANSQNGEPIKGVSIQEKINDYSRNYTKLLDGELIITNDKGYGIRKKTTNNSNLAIISLAKDSLMVATYEQGRVSYYSKRVILFTDRPIYRPGQTIYYKGLFLASYDDKNTILPADSLDLSFNDANYQKIETIKIKTNEFGTFQGFFTIPTGKMNGSMQLSTIYGSIEVQVEEYKRPTFEVVFNPANQKYKLNDSVLVQGKAIAFAGYAVTGAKVKYTAYSSVMHTYSRYYQNQAPKQIAIGKTETKADGNFSFTFLAKPDNNTTENYSYEVRAEITDLNGETRTQSKTINVGKKDLLLDLNLPEQLFLTSKTDSIAFNILNLNGQPTKATLKAEWFLLQQPNRLVNKNPFNVIPEKYALSKTEFIKIFDTEDYAGDSDPANWPTNKLNFTEKINSPLGKGNLKLNLKNLPTGCYKIKFTAINNDNDTINTDRIIRIYAKEPTTIQQTAEWLVAEKTTISPTEPAIFRLAGALPNGTAYYEIYYKDDVIEKVWLKTSPMQSIIKIMPKPNTNDGFAVQFTQIQNGVIYNTLEQVKIINPAKELEIKFLTFRNKLQPGEKETWKLKISNKAGEKEMAEMVATLYDASLNDLKKMDWDKFNPQPYYYNHYNWNFNLNNQQNSNELWFLKNYNYQSLKTRDYENLNYFNYNYFGSYNYSYNNYLQTIAIQKRKELPVLAVKKLAQLAKGGLGFSNLIYGLVTDQNGYTLPNVAVSNGKTKTITDENGIYQIVAKTGQRLSFKYFNYNSLEKTVTAKRLDVRLIAIGYNLNEVSVFAYGAQQKREMATGSTTIRIRGTSSIENTADEPIAQSLALAGKTQAYIFNSIDDYDPKTNMRMVNGKIVSLPPKIIPRTNFSETAFFYPQLQTNQAGEINIEFTIPQSLTRYNMMGFAHTKDLKTATITQDLVTQKQLAISVNAPRFFREADTILLSAKLNNLSGATLKGNANLELRDALTNKTIQIFVAKTSATQNFELADNGNQVLKWPLIIPTGVSAISYKVIAQAGAYSDGEEMTIPVLPNNMLVTQTMPLNVRGNSSKTFTMDKLLQASTSKTIRHQSLTLTFTANPIWYAIQALPYLMVHPYECTEQIFSSFYANSFASGIINSSPKIKTVFTQWQQTNNGEALLSNLEKNQELKSILLEETPWIRAANSETESKKRLAVLFDLNRMTNELKTSFEKLEKMQNSNGSFPWFSGMDEDRYITQHIVLGIGQLKHLNLIDEKLYPGFYTILNKAIIYLDNKLAEDFSKEQTKKSVGYIPLHYLNARSYTNQKNTNANFTKAMAYYLKKTAENWKFMEPYQQGQAALILSRSGNKAEALKIINLLKQTAQQSEEMGMYWANNTSGWWWYQNPIETQALLIEVFDEVAADSLAVEEMKIWLLKNKQTNNWETSKATTAACYALLMRGYNLLAENTEPEILIGNKTFSQLGVTNVPKEAGTGYQKTTFTALQVKPEMGKIEVKNNNKTIAWGGLYWQYFEQLDKITAAATGVKIKKQLFLQTETTKGNVLTPLTATNVLAVGDLLKVRIEIYTDRDLEYVHLKDMRSAGFEPVNVISQYKYQDGLGYYESTKDASTNFFISYLEKGVYVFEYALIVTHAGNFSNGITTLQSMYAPEFATHSQGIRVNVKP